MAARKPKCPHQETRERRGHGPDWQLNSFGWHSGLPPSGRCVLRSALVHRNHVLGVLCHRGRFTIPLFLYPERSIPLRIYHERIYWLLPVEVRSGTPASLNIALVELNQVMALCTRPMVGCVQTVRSLRQKSSERIWYVMNNGASFKPDGPLCDLFDDFGQQSMFPGLDSFG